MAPVAGLTWSLAVYLALSVSVSAFHVLIKSVSLSKVGKSVGKYGRCSRRKQDAGGALASPLARFEACSAFQKRLRQLVNLSEGSTL